MGIVSTAERYFLVCKLRNFLDIALREVGCANRAAREEARGSGGILPILSLHRDGIGLWVLATSLLLTTEPIARKRGARGER